MQVWYRTVSLVTSSESKQKFVGKIFVGDTLLSENFSWMEANHENNGIKSTTKIFTFMVVSLLSQFSNYSISMHAHVIINDACLYM